MAIPSTEREWLEATRQRTVREVEQLVSGHRPGDLPSDAPKPAAKRHVLRFEGSGETLATFREAMAKIRRDAGESLGDDAALLLFSRHVLEGSRDEGRSSYQLALTVCEECRRGTQQGRGEGVEVTPHAVAMAECDAQHIGHVDAVVSDAHVGANQEPTRAKQSIAPARRRTVLRRDGGCCRVPGCRNATFVDVHHLRPRAERGSDDIENLVTLCAAHHQAIHEGRIFCEGSPAMGLTFRHADGTRYGGALAPTGAGQRATALRALTQMGFGHAETTLALGRIVSSDALALDVLLRKALRELVPPAP